MRRSLCFYILILMRMLRLHGNSLGRNEVRDRLLIVGGRELDLYRHVARDLVVSDAFQP